MHITLDVALFDAPSSAEETALEHLFSTAVRQSHLYAHALLTNPPYPAGLSGALEAWLDQHPRHLQNAYRSLLAQGPIIAAGVRGQLASDSKNPRHWHIPGLLTIRVERRQTSDWRNKDLTIADAVDLLAEPLHLVLENERTDFSFLCHLLGVSHGSVLKSLCDAPGRIYMHPGGGGAVKKWLGDLLTGPPTAAVWRRMLRAWVFFDRDSGEHDARDASKTAGQIIDECEKVVQTLGPGLSWICLQRREIESYAPDKGLQTAAASDAQRAFANEVVRWRADQTNRVEWAWALDLKKGLRGDLHAKWSHGLPETAIAEVKRRKVPPQPHMLKMPFSSLSPAEIDSLQDGFDERLSRTMTMDSPPMWTADIPLEYDRGPADQTPRTMLVQSLFDRM